MMTINKKEFVRRRKQLMEQMETNSIAVLKAAPIKIRNRDAEYVYLARQ